ncbi:MAG: AlkZ family DNA glycosylase [Caldilineaceae bacterium]|nr:AlkZ family DNA glycosylase [Caldilineaceae bacterium]MBP8109323.1 AlkZ family DNA glycosylase [Caldilineaceae bacterium]MBP8124387.1 AlkZ family DNA glycosylase [Caldilineaceae bacterium]
MTNAEIARQRLTNHRIAHEKFDLPSQVVTSFGAMQAQDYASAKWAIGLRCTAATEATINQAIADRTIVRSWLMRGTLHVVAAVDVRWMLTLLAPRLIAGAARRHQQLELDQATFARSFKVLADLLEGGKEATRAEIRATLEQVGISTAGQRLYHILGQAVLAELVCFASGQNNQEAFALLDDWVPHGKSLEGDEALAALAERYFKSRGPATLQDFVWWSGLLVGDARRGLEGASPRLHQEKIQGQTYWLPQDGPPPAVPSSTACLLPAFDEYYLGYRGRDAVLDAVYDKRVASNNGVFRPIIVIDGQVVGIWRRVAAKGSVVITPQPFRALTVAEDQAVHVAANQIRGFLGLPSEPE